MKENRLNNEARKWREQLAKCVRCGSCRAVCPVFGQSGNENLTARAKIRLVEELLAGRLELTPRLAEIFGRCLVCKSCVKACPSGVKSDELFIGVRRALAERRGLPLFKRLALSSLGYRRLFELGLKLGACFQDLILKDAPEGRGKVSRIPLPAAGLNQRRLLPALADTPLAGLAPRLPVPSRPRAKVAFFPGCMLSYVYPQAGLAILEVLRANDLDVFIPRNLGCCGTPAYISGDFATAGLLARRNLKILDQAGCAAVITGCATCATALKFEYAQIFEDSPELGSWRALSDKVFDFAQYLTLNGFNKDFAEVNLKVTYHDPCHLVRQMGVARQPREILRAIPGLELIEMQGADKCCGSGGTFSLAHYDMARRIGAEKIACAINTGAQAVLTGCAACRMQIADAAQQAGSALEVRHAAEIMAKAYRLARGINS